MIFEFRREFKEEVSYDCMISDVSDAIDIKNKILIQFRLLIMNFVTTGVF